MGTIIAIIAGILMLMILVVIHELGHFWAAKKLGVKVLEFGVGIPPKAKKLWTDAGGTEYTLNWIPLGGFVRLKGEDPSDEADFLADDSLITASLWRKIVILLAGIFMNFVTTYLIFVVVFAVGVKPITVIDTMDPNGSYLYPTVGSLTKKGFIDGSIDQYLPVVEQVIDGSLAGQNNIQKGDTILSVDGKQASVFTIVNNLSKISNKTISIDIKKVGTDVVDTISVDCPKKCVLGLGFDPQFNNVSLGMQSFNVAWSELVYQSRFALKALGTIGSKLISFNGKATKDGLAMMTGPAGAIKVGQILANRLGFSGALAFAGLISLSLALFNLLPIPALDGGRVVGSIIQAVGRFKPQKYFVIENYINMFFFIVLMGLGIYILGQDLVRAWGLFGG